MLSCLRCKEKTSSEGQYANSAVDGQPVNVRHHKRNNLCYSTRAGTTHVIVAVIPTQTHTHTSTNTSVLFALLFSVQLLTSPHLTQGGQTKQETFARSLARFEQNLCTLSHTRGEKFATPFSLAHANNGTIWVSCHVRIPLQKWQSRANGGELLVKDFSREAFVFRVAMPSGSKLEVIFGSVDHHLHFLGFPVYRMWT